jgi:NADH-quinone oxidoreductase subunit C
VAEQEENQEPASPPSEPTGTPAAAAHGDPEPVADPLEKLTPDGKELLEVSLDVLKDFAPQAGALDNIPQVSFDKKHTLEACRLMKDDPRIGAQMLLCLACVDYTEYFQMVYVLQSLRPERTLVLRTDTPYSDPTIPSVTSVWRAADWYEREAHDLFGVSFDGHPDMSPLLLYEGFEGFPGRKEFPFNEYQEF